MSESPDKPPTLWTRRNVLNRISWALLGTSIGGTLVAGVRALFPRVRPTPPSTVVLGRPDEFSVGEVSEKWKKSHRIFLVRTAEGFYAVRSVCTHLGCIPGWQSSQKKFKCFCHGSGFHIDGTNFEGPAPRPLERLGIALDSGGRIVVDTAERFRAETGGWSAHNAFLKWKGNA